MRPTLMVGACLVLLVFSSCSRNETAAQSRPNGEDPGALAKRPDSERIVEVADRGGNDSGLTAGEIFTRRMLPILRSDDASSCTECHFGGVDLSSYIRDDQATTFAALRAEGLIDVDKPDDSKILRFIGRHAADTDPLIVNVRQAESQAFRSWIRAAVKDPDLLATKDTDVRIGSELSDEVIRHMRRDRVLDSFVETVWSQIGRCLRCHSPDKNEKLVAKHGEQMSWIRPNDPYGTMLQCVEQRIIDVDDPEESLLLLKPLGKEDHGGGRKFALGSRTDKSFRRFLNDYAAVLEGKYRRSEELPEPANDIAVLTDQQLRIVGLPDRLDKMLLKVDLYRHENGRWSKTPWGTADNRVVGERGLWQSMVSAAAPAASERGKRMRGTIETRLPGGRYLVKIYVDQRYRTRADGGYELGEADLYGQVETDGEWPPGYQPPKIIQAPAVR